MPVLVIFGCTKKFAPNQMALEDNIYYLTFSVGQASISSLAGSSGSGSLRGCNQDRMTCVILRLESKIKLSEAQSLGSWQGFVLCGQSGSSPQLPAGC